MLSPRLSIMLTASATLIALGVWNNLLWQQSSLQQEHSNLRRQTSTLHQKEHNQDSVQIDAVVTLALNGFRPTLLISSLWSTGKWEKPIFVLSDEAEFLKQTSENATILSTDHRLPNFSTPTELQEFVHFKETNFSNHYFKWFKSQVFEYLPPEVETVLFLDADIAVVKPLDDWIQDAASVIQNIKSGNCNIGIYREIWFSGYLGAKNTGKWNSGIMVLHRNSSRELLEEWGRRIVSKPYAKRDQQKLTDAMEYLESSSSSSVVCPLPHKNYHLVMEQNVVDQLWRKVGLRDPTFRHLGTGKKMSDLEKGSLDSS